MERGKTHCEIVLTIINLLKALMEGRQNIINDYCIDCFLNANKVRLQRRYT